MITNEQQPVVVSVPESKSWMSDPTFYTSSDVYSTWHTIRTQRSGYVESFTAAGTRYHSFFDYEECATVLRDDRRFTSRYGTIIESIDYPDTARDITMTVSDGATHDFHRTPANHCMSKKSVEQQSEAIKSEVRAIVDSVEPGEDVDLCQYTKALPMGLFGPMLPVERKQWSELSDLVYMSILPDDPAYTNGMHSEAARRMSHAGIFALLSDAIDEHGRSADGVFGRYLNSEKFSSQDSPFESILANSYSLLMGAHATTNQVANHFARRLAWRGDLAMATQDPATAHTVINEAVRWVSPTNHLLRRAVSDTELGGVLVSEGDWVVAWVGSANRDETASTLPHRFNPGRRGKHLGFGIGSHYCIGSHIATFGLAYFFELLLKEFELAPGTAHETHAESNWINGFSRMPLTINEKREQR